MIDNYTEVGIIIHYTSKIPDTCERDSCKTGKNTIKDMHKYTNTITQTQSKTCTPRQCRCEREMVVKHRWTQKSLLLVNVVMTHNDIRILAFITITIIVTITIKVNEYPWMVGLYTRTASLPSCGGSLINSKYLILIKVSLFINSKYY